MCLVPGRRGSGTASPLAGAQALPLQSRGSGAVEGERFGPKEQLPVLYLSHIGEMCTVRAAGAVQREEFKRNKAVQCVQIISMSV